MGAGDGTRWVQFLVLSDCSFAPVVEELSGRGVSFLARPRRGPLVRESSFLTEYWGGAVALPRVSPLPPHVVTSRSPNPSTPPPSLRIDPRYMEPPTYVYYELENYYQNHRRYVKSRNSYQLLGEVRLGQGLVRAGQLWPGGVTDGVVQLSGDCLVVYTVFLPAPVAHEPGWSSALGRASRQRVRALASSTLAVGPVTLSVLLDGCTFA